MEQHTGSLDGRVYLVTAGASGIGRAAASRIAAAGGKVMIVDINDQMGAEAVADIRAKGGQADYTHADVRSRADLDAAVTRTEQIFGPLSGAVAGAGTSATHPAEDFPRQDWTNVLDISLTGCFNTCQIVGARLIENGGGSIITISSVNAHGAHAGRIAYCAAKSGVVGLTRALAVEWGPRGVRVNSVAPGITNTPPVARGLPKELLENVLLDRIPLERMAEPDDLGAMCAYLMSDDAAYVNGAVINVDGGLAAGYMTTRRFRAPVEQEVRSQND